MAGKTPFDPEFLPTRPATFLSFETKLRARPCWRCRTYRRRRPHWNCLTGNPITRYIAPKMDGS